VHQHFFDDNGLLKTDTYAFEENLIMIQMLEEHRNRQDNVLSTVLEIDHFIVRESPFVVFGAIYQLLCFVVKEKLGVVAVIKNIWPRLRVLLDSSIKIDLLLVLLQLSVEEVCCSLFCFIQDLKS